MVLCSDSFSKYEIFENIHIFKHYLRRDGDVDILVPPDAGPELRHGGHRGGDHGAVVVRVTGLGLTWGRGRGGERRRGRGQVIITAVHCCRRMLLHVSVLMLQGLSFTA